MCPRTPAFSFRSDFLPTPRCTCMHIQCIYIDVRRTYSYNFIATEIISRNYSMPRLTTLTKSKAGFPSMMSGDLADVVVNLHSGSIIGIAICIYIYIYICMGQA